MPDNTVQNPISIFIGPDTEKYYEALNEDIGDKKGINLFGDGKTLINLDAIVNPIKTKIAVIHAHGGRALYNDNIIHYQPLLECGDNIFSSCTIQNILSIQKKTGATDFYILSCHARSAISAIRESYGDLLPNTSIIMIGTSRGITLGHPSSVIVKFIVDQYNAGEGGLFSKIAVLFPQTITLCKVSRDQRLLELKYSLPKKEEDISDIKSYLLGTRALRGSEELVDLIKPLLRTEVEKLTSEQVQDYKDCALYISMNLMKHDHVSRWKTHGAVVTIFITIAVGYYVGDSSQLLQALKEDNYFFYVKDLIQMENKELYPNAYNPQGLTALHIAVEKGDCDLVKLLLGCPGIDPNTVELYGKKTALYIAVEKGHRDLVKLFRDFLGINANLPDENGETPLFYAVQSDNLEIFNLLIDSGKVNLHCINKLSGDTILQSAEKQLQLYIDALSDIESKLQGKSLTHIEQHQTQIQSMYSAQEVMHKMITKIETALTLDNLIGRVVNNVATEMQITTIEQHNISQALGDIAMK